MHIYSNDDLYNRWVQEQADEALKYNCIGHATHEIIVKNYPSKLYTPNYFIRIAMALLTIVAVVFATLLAGLMVNSSFGNSMIALAFLLGIITYAALELLVQQKSYYNAGVDNILVFFSALFFAGAFTINTYAHQPFVVSIVSVVICLWMAVRFTDTFMAMLFYVALLASVFTWYIELGNFAKTTAPFVMMAVSFAAYYSASKLVKYGSLSFYQSCFSLIRLLALLSFYGLANYFVVSELRKEIYNLAGNVDGDIPFAWLFWMLTIAIPILYFVLGIKREDLMFIRIGVVLAAVSIATVTYYYSLFPPEVVMLVAGCVLTTIGFYLMRLLKKPIRNFVFSKNTSPRKEAIALNAILLVETTRKKDVAEPHTNFNEGTSGGAGAGSSY